MCKLWTGNNKRKATKPHREKHAERYCYGSRLHSPRTRTRTHTHLSPRGPRTNMHPYCVNIPRLTQPLCAQSPHKFNILLGYQITSFGIRYLNKSSHLQILIITPLKKNNNIHTDYILHLSRTVIYLSFVVYMHARMMI